MGGVAEGSETGSETKFWVRTAEPHQIPYPQLPSFAQSFEKSWTRSGSGNWREAQHLLPPAPHSHPPVWADTDL